MAITIERAETVIMAACALHNFLRSRLPNFTNHLVDREDEQTHEVIPGTWRSDASMEGLPRLARNTAQFQAKRQREDIMAFVNGPGKVSWQDDVLAD